MKMFTAVIAMAMMAQAQAQNNVQGLVEAERSFAAFSVQHGTRAAFLRFADSNAVVFEKGEAVNALHTWAKKDSSTGVLNWQPLFAEITATADFGYTTGPWTFENSGSGSIAARGQFITVWHLNKKGEWKFLVDIGTGNAPQSNDTRLQIITTAKKQGNKNTEELLSAERAFIAAFAKERAGAYKRFLSATSILQRNSHLPASSPGEREQVIRATPGDLQFTVTGYTVAPDGSMACVYGNTQRIGQHENFLHIWRREKQGWKLALEVLRYR